MIGHWGAIGLGKILEPPRRASLGILLDSSVDSVEVDFVGLEIVGEFAVGHGEVTSLFQNFGGGGRRKIRESEGGLSLAVAHCHGEEVGGVVVLFEHCGDGDFRVGGGYLYPFCNSGTVEDGGESVDLVVYGGDGGEHFGVVEEGVFVEFWGPLVDEVEDTHRAVDQGHPDFGFDLVRGGFVVYVADSRAFDAVPHRLVRAGPFHEALDAVGHEPEFAGGLGAGGGGRVDVEGDDIGALDVLGIVLGVVGAHAATDVFVPGDALAEVEEDGAGGIVGLDFLVAVDDYLREDRRAVALAFGEGLGVVRLVAVHPGDDEVVVDVAEADGVLGADDRHSGGAEFGQLGFGGALPEADVEVDAGRLVAFGVGRALEPDGDREVVGLFGRAVLPGSVLHILGVLLFFGILFVRVHALGGAGADQGEQGYQKYGQQAGRFHGASSEVDGRKWGTQMVSL